MDEPTKIAARDEAAVNDTRAEWHRPEWRKVDVGEAESGFNVGPDFTFS